MNFKESYLLKEGMRKGARRATIPVVATIAAFSLGATCSYETNDIKFPPCSTDPQRKTQTENIGTKGDKQYTLKVDGIIFDLAGPKDNRRVDISLADEKKDSNRVELVNDTWFEFDGKENGRHYIVKKGEQKDDLLPMTVTGICKDKEVTQTEG